MICVISVIRSIPTLVALCLSMGTQGVNTPVNEVEKGHLLMDLHLELLLDDYATQKLLSGKPQYVSEGKESKPFQNHKHRKILTVLCTKLPWMYEAEYVLMIFLGFTAHCWL